MPMSELTHHDSEFNQEIHASFLIMAKGGAEMDRYESAILLSIIFALQV